MPNFSTLGERMKFYEDLCGKQLCPLLPAVVRLDGKAFHTFTRGMEKPFDRNLMNLMSATTTFLAMETGASLAYTQSDEITLILPNDDPKSQIYFDGRVDKINSVLAATCSVYFNTRTMEWPSGRALDLMPVFDCRCFNVPTEKEAVNVLVWREMDAVRNSIQALGQAHFSHFQLALKSCDDIQEMLFREKQINWNDLTPACKRGTYVQRKRVVRPFTTEEIDKLPPKHSARKDPNLTVERWEFDFLEMPPITKVINAENVVFRGTEPITANMGEQK